MNSRSSNALLLALRIGALASCVLFSPPASAEPAPLEAPDASEQPLTDTLERCVAEHERARISQVEGQVHEAYEALQSCAVDECPLAVRADCRTWLGELRASLPTVVLLLDREGELATGVKATLDGAPIALAETMAPLELLPGPHEFRFELDSYAPIEERVELALGEKNRVLRVHFVRRVPGTQPPAPAPPTSAARSKATPPHEVSPSKAAPATPDSEFPLTSAVLGGGALVAAGTSLAFLASALKASDDADRTCAPNCSSDVRQAIDTRLLLADGSGLLAIVLGTLALRSYVIETSDDGPRVAVHATPEQAGFSLWGAF